MRERVIAIMLMFATYWHEDCLSRRDRIEGFTLIELSIVLVIIGLIVGGVLIGQSLISAAEVRAQITQIEKYNAAVNTFRSKFNYLPGDIVASAVSQFGFWGAIYCSGTPVQGYRDGNGLIEGGVAPYTLDEVSGETQLFWVDLGSIAAGNLIEQQFPNGGASITGCGAGVSLSTTIGTGYIGDWLPSAKIGHGNFEYVYAIGGSNWFGLSAVTAVNATMTSGANIPVAQAYKIDLKFDDGMPASGNIQSNYINNKTGNIYAPNTATSGGTSSSCYDTITGTYSVTVNNGNGGNCALSFKFQ